MVRGIVGDIGCIVQCGDEKEVAEDVVDADCEVWSKAMGGDVFLDFGEGRDVSIGDVVLFGLIGVAIDFQVW